MASTTSDTMAQQKLSRLEFVSLPAEEGLLWEEVAPHTLLELAVFARDTGHLVDTRLAIEEEKVAAVAASSDTAEMGARKNAELPWSTQKSALESSLVPLVETGSTYQARADARGALLAQLQDTSDARQNVLEKKEGDSKATAATTALRVPGGDDGRGGFWGFWGSPPK
jgi:hypothetical protein